MANEITVLQGSGGLEFNVLFYYTIPSPVSVAGQPVVVSPSSNLPEIASRVLTQPEKDALDAGTAAFETTTILVNDSDSNATILARARALYASKKQDYLSRYTRAMRFIGSRFNEV